MSKTKKIPKTELTLSRGMVEWVKGDEELFDILDNSFVTVVNLIVLFKFENYPSEICPKSYKNLKITKNWNLRKKLNEE